VSWSDKSAFVVAVIFYGLSAGYSIFLYGKGFRHHNRVTYLLLAGAFTFHTVAMFWRGFAQNRCPINNIYETTTFVVWTIVAIYLVIGLWSRLRFLGAFASPVLFAIGVFALMPSLDPVAKTQPIYAGGLASLHAALILLAYGAFGLSSVAGFMYLCQEYDLKHRKLRAVSSLLPPIQRLEIVIGRSLICGFVLLTTGLAVGAFGLQLPSGASYWQDPKVHWSVFVWLLYLAQLVLHWGFAQRGRRFAWGAIGSFAFVILTFWGFSLLSGIHNPS
jgi:ABC-type uncharacterized transport system permease subunit